MTPERRLTKKEIGEALHALWTAEECSIEVDSVDNYTSEGTHRPTLQNFQAVNLACFKNEASEWVFDGDLVKIVLEILRVSSVHLYQDGFSRKADCLAAK